MGYIRKAKRNKPYYSVGSVHDIHTISSSYDFSIPYFSGNALPENHPQPLDQVMEQALLALQSVKWQCSSAVDNRTYCVASRSASCDRTVLR